MIICTIHTMVHRQSHRHACTVLNMYYRVVTVKVRRQYSSTGIVVWKARQSRPPSAVVMSTGVIPNVRKHELKEAPCKTDEIGRCSFMSVGKSELLECAIAAQMPSVNCSALWNGWNVLGCPIR